MSVAVNLVELDDLVAAEGIETVTSARLAPLGSTPSAVLAECTCPEWCEHDHENE